MKEVLLIKLGEMVLKGQNRRVFDQALLKNIKQALRGTGALDVRYAQSTVYVIPEDAESDMDLAEERIGKVFGVISVSYTHLDVYKRQSLRRSQRQ